MPSAPPSSAEIQNMFDRLARRYDIFNRLTSLGLDNFWRKEAVKGLKKGESVLDLGCGTGDLSFLAARQVLPGGRVVGLDFSPAMLEQARLRQRRLGLNGATPLSFVRKSAEELPLDGERFDCVVSGFVLRNMSERIDEVLAGMAASLNSGGRVRLLDFTEPDGRLQRLLWRVYLNGAGAVFGALLFGRDFPHFYMTRSAERFVKPNTFLQKLTAAGFKDASVRRMMMGSVVLYEARRP